MQQNDNVDNGDLPGLVAIPVPEEPLQRNVDVDFQRTLNNLTQELLDEPGGHLCLLCTTSNRRECIWNEIAIDIILAGETAIKMHDAINDTTDIAARHSAA